ncbi:hypothetical protein H0O02_01565 [Candidatus Micrarchaeota archaeon]|nr:hypothetical protein [Candidatus Micrarchaeota archaeon]
MYHIGKTVEVISQAKDRRIKSADTKVQALVAMWDENMLVLEVDKKIAGALAAGDYVLADYSPVSEESPYRKMIITKILPAEKGRKIWDEFQKMLSKKKSAVSQVPGGNLPYR